MTPFRRHSRKGKIIGTKTDQWLPGAEVGNKVLTTTTNQFGELLEQFEVLIYSICICQNSQNGTLKRVNHTSYCI